MYGILGLTGRYEGRHQHIFILRWANFFSRREYERTFDINLNQCPCFWENPQTFRDCCLFFIFFFSSSLFFTEEETAVRLETSEGFLPIFFFKRRDTNLNLHEDYLDLHALHSFNTKFQERTLLSSKQPKKHKKGPDFLILLRQLTRGR